MKKINLDDIKSLRIALVHDWLNGMRGGEKCLEVFCEIFPKATLFSLLYDKDKLSKKIGAMNIQTSFIQKVPFLISHYRYLLPFFPNLIERFDFNGYDLILSSSHCVAKGIIPGKNSFHISYIHTPMRYIWSDFDTYFNRKNTSIFIKIIAKKIKPFLQNWDKNSSKRVHSFLCNSKNIQGKIKSYYKRNAKVIHPPVDLNRFKPGGEKKSYYLIVGAFAPNKRLDLSIRVFNKLNIPL